MGNENGHNIRHMQEIEILYNLTENFSAAERKLKKKFGKPLLVDIYDKYYKIGRRRCLRLRRTANKRLLTYKQDVYQGKKWLYSKEFEAPVSQEIVKILERRLGVDVKYRIIKHIFETDQYQIILERIPQVGVFLEVEKRGRARNIERAKNEIRKFVKGLGIKTGKELNQFKPEIVKKVLRNK